MHVELKRLKKLYSVIVITNYLLLKIFFIGKQNALYSTPNKPSLKLGLFGTLKLELALQFIVTNTYFSVARTLTLVLHATLK